MARSKEYKSPWGAVIKDDYTSHNLEAKNQADLAQSRVQENIARINANAHNYQVDKTSSSGENRMFYPEPLKPGESSVEIIKGANRGEDRFDAAGKYIPMTSERVYNETMRLASLERQQNTSTGGTVQAAKIGAQGAIDAAKVREQGDLDALKEQIKIAKEAGLMQPNNGGIPTSGGYVYNPDGTAMPVGSQQSSSPTLANSRMINTTFVPSTPSVSTITPNIVIPQVPPEELKSSHQKRRNNMVADIYNSIFGY